MLQIPRLACEDTRQTRLVYQTEGLNDNNNLLTHKIITTKGRPLMQYRTLFCVDRNLLSRTPASLAASPGHRKAGHFTTFRYKCMHFPPVSNIRSRASEPQDDLLQLLRPALPEK